ncbi:alpha/beta fold hydrolase [Algoriphagus taiwanensis]|uniref:AB hydrolase-1 domain-containing protein n=1 Tax=Algoriphagus taiwanensis TaxID=1445656 RepID=A0ABQ6Q5J6_9BACT|nr:hypothetical protein Ataiwa_37200 [Algoriphagus taiwanensis]
MDYFKHSLGNLAYREIGKGQEVTLLFHGFGQTHRDMLPFEKIRKKNQRFIFIDAFYHGRSTWKDSGKSMDRKNWLELIGGLQNHLNFTDFHLVGYSMGGKISLITYELFSTNVLSLTLLAPDGIKTGLWYSMSNYPDSFHPIMKQVVFKPQGLFRIMEGLGSVGLIQSSLKKFFQTQMGTRSQRAQMYFTWKITGGLQPRLGQIIQSARKLKTPVSLFLGEFDQMITEDNLKKFSSKIPQIQTVVLPVGHGGLIEATAEYLLEQLKGK